MKFTSISASAAASQLLLLGCLAMSVVVSRAAAFGVGVSVSPTLVHNTQESLHNQPHNSPLAVHSHSSRQRMTPTQTGKQQGGIAAAAAARSHPHSPPRSHASASALTRGGATASGSGSSSSIGLWESYNKALDSKPLLTKALTSLVGWALGDVLAQVFISGGASVVFDWRRFATLSAFGFLYHGPSGHYFYNWLDSKIKGTDGLSVFSKVAIDQLLWCPVFMTVFFTYLGLVNGDSVPAITTKIRQDLLSACQGSWKVWPLVHAVNFKFISTKHRLVFINSVQIAFNMFLSLIGTKK